ITEMVEKKPFRQPGSLKESRSFASPPREGFAFVVQSMPEGFTEKGQNQPKRPRATELQLRVRRLGPHVIVQGRAVIRSNARRSNFSPAVHGHSVTTTRAAGSLYRARRDPANRRR